jgi:hypothetical protein
VAGYLSDEWFDQLGAAPERPGDGGHQLVLQHVVTGGPSGETRYHVLITDGRAQIIRGVAADPDVTFAEDYATAASIASGQLSAPTALLAGRIRVAGDMAALVARQGELAVDDPVPPAARAATTY